jgi:tRNA threonylcarbamoyladenosine biosynthesis protein TsaE
MEKIALTELDQAAQKVLAMLPQKIKGASVIALEGDLGAGKTTFVQALGKALGIQENMQSPTYVLMKTYAISYKNLVQLLHIDAYRLSGPAEFKTLKPELFLKDAKNLVCVEWPGRIESALPAPDIKITLSSEGAREGERLINIENS